MTNTTDMTIVWSASCYIMAPTAAASGLTGLNYTRLNNTSYANNWEGLLHLIKHFKPMTAATLQIFLFLSLLFHQLLLRRLLLHDWIPLFTESGAATWN